MQRINLYPSNRDNFKILCSGSQILSSIIFIIIILLVIYFYNLYEQHKLSLELNALLAQNKQEKILNMQEESEIDFAEYFSLFGKYNTDELWLTKIKITQQGEGILLQGEATAAIEVSKFIQWLWDEPLFQNKEIAELKILAKQNTGKFPKAIVSFIVQIKKVI